MTEIQLLNNSQIENILDIVSRDYIKPQLKTKMEELKASEAYTKALEEITTSEENTNKIAEIEKEYQTNLKVASLYRKLNIIGKSYVSSENSWGEIDTINWLVDTTDEQILNRKNIDLDGLRYSNEQKVWTNLNVRFYDWDVISPIKLDLEARLQLIAVTDLDSIINAIVKFIDIDKYIYIK